MVNTQFTIETSLGTLTADYHTGEIPIPTRGETVTYEFELPESDFNTLLDFTDFAGSYSAYEGDDNLYRYIEHLPNDASFSSLVVGINPSQDLQDRDVPGVWGLIETVEDTRNQPLSDTRIALEVFVIAEFDDFADADALRAERDVAQIGQDFDMEAQTMTIEGGEITATILTPANFDVTINDLTFTSQGTPANFDVTIDDLTFVGDINQNMTAHTIDIQGGEITATLIGGPISEAMNADSMTINGGEITQNLV